MYLEHFVCTCVYIHVYKISISNYISMMKIEKGLY